MPVQIHINGENATDALNDLKELAANLIPSSGAAPAAPAAEAPKTDKPSRSRSTAKATEQEKPVDPVVNEDVDNADATPDEVGDSAPVPTDVELRAKAQEVGTTPELKKAIKALLDKFGSKNITEMPEEKRAAFLADLEALAKPVEDEDEEF